MNICKEDARTLLERGYVMLPGYESSTTREAQACFDECTTRFGEELRLFRFEHDKRPDGEYEPDDGFLDWTGGGLSHRKDQKFVFHYRPDLLQRMEAIGFSYGRYEEVDRLLRLSRGVYDYHEGIAFAIAGALDGLGVVPWNFTKLLEEAKWSPVATSRSTLRLLHYPPKASSEKAKVHYDRSFLTLHAGDRGGDLFILREDGREEVVSPKEGEALVFWGCKARRLALRHGLAIEPMAHGSRGAPDEERQAVVSFWHTNDVLWDADPVPSSVKAVA